MKQGSKGSPVVLSLEGVMRIHTAPAGDGRTVQLGAVFVCMGPALLVCMDGMNGTNMSYLPPPRRLTPMGVLGWSSLCLRRGIQGHNMGGECPCAKQGAGHN